MKGQRGGKSKALPMAAGGAGSVNKKSVNSLRRGRKEMEESVKDSTSKFYICLKCDNGIEEEEESIQCYDCKQWIHKECTPLSERDFRYLCEDSASNAGIQWACEFCLENEGERKGEVEAKLDRLISLFESVDTRLSRLENSNSGEALDKKIEDTVSKKVNELWEEKIEREKRELNLVISNIPESDKNEREERQKDDVDAVKSLVQKICPGLEKEQITEPVRLGKVNAGSQPRLLKVKVKSLDIKKEILKNARELNRGVKTQDKKIYINPDQTPTERQKSRELRQELKRRTGEGETDIGIRGGKIVKVRWSQKEDHQSEQQN